MTREGEVPDDQIPLVEPRPLTPKERTLIDFLLDSPLGRDELRKQAASSRVAGVCSCGCPSIWLAVDPATPSAKFRPEETAIGRTDWVPITAFQQKSRGTTEVTLHVVKGRLHELEIWAGGYGIRPRVDPTKLQYEDEGLE